MGGLKMPKDDLGGVFKFLLSSIPTEQYDAWVLKDLILIQFYTCVNMGWQAYATPEYVVWFSRLC